DGRVVWALLTVSLVRDEEGRPHFAVGMVEDISERKRVEEALTLLVEASAGILGSLDLDQVLNSILDLARRLIGADAYAVWRFLRRHGEWRVLADRGLSPGYLRALPPTSNPLPDLPFPIENVDQAPLLAWRQAAHQAEGIRALLVAPLRLDGEKAGTLTFY